MNLPWLASMVGQSSNPSSTRILNSGNHIFIRFPGFSFVFLFVYFHEKVLFGLCVFVTCNRALNNGRPSMGGAINTGCTRETFAHMSTSCFVQTELQILDNNKNTMAQSQKGHFTWQILKYALHKLKLKIRSLKQNLCLRQNQLNYQLVF